MNASDTTPKTHDWSRADAMTDADVHTAAMADPDARPLTDEEFARVKRVPRVRTLRRVLGLTQDQFAARFEIPLGTLRDWEQGRAEPDGAGRAYLRAIAGDPDAIQHALHEAHRRAA
jgi:putative transcriptional regulator